MRRLIFASGSEYRPDKVHGAILGAHELLEHLVAAGHEVEAVAGLSSSGPRGWGYRLRRLLTRRRRLAWPDRDNGYTTWRAWSTFVPSVVDERITESRPDLVLTQLDDTEPIVERALARDVPVVVYIWDADFLWMKKGLPEDERVLLLVCSEFLQGRVRKHLGRESEVVLPSIALDRYRVSEHRPRYVTLVNPVAKKGVAVALQAARLLPHHEFLFVKCWPMLDHAEKELRDAVAELPNVHLRERTLDMREVYSETALLLVPSQWEEAFGRVILEAQASGIPVVASRIGGIPEALGNGGVLLEPDSPAEAWAEAVSGILSTPPRLADLRERALANAASVPVRPEVVARRFLSVVDNHLAKVKGRNLS